MKVGGVRHHDPKGRLQQLRQPNRRPQGSGRKIRNIKHPSTHNGEKEGLIKGLSGDLCER
ncbi:unnamed protein product, partial [Arctogadus glacialis]